MNHKNERIKALILRDITEPERIARKTGLTLERVLQGLKVLQDRHEIEKIKK